MPTETENLIQNMAREAGDRQATNDLSAGQALLAATALALAVAMVMVTVVIGVRPDLMNLMQNGSPLFKLASTLLLACGGFIVAKHTMQPDAPTLHLIALLPGVVLLAAGAAMDHSGLSVLGASNISVPACVGAILMLSIPAFVLVLRALRTGAPTRPNIAGAAAGFLSGALGAAAYALACKNDGELFVAVWYGAAILMMTGLGAVIGRRALVW